MGVWTILQGIFTVLVGGKSKEDTGEGGGGVKEVPRDSHNTSVTFGRDRIFCVM